MRPLRIEGQTQYTGRPQGYLGLSIHDHVIDCPVNGPGTPAMMTAWEPFPDEVERIAFGALVYVEILGRLHPPIKLIAGPLPEVGGRPEFPRDTRLERIAAIVAPLLPGRERLGADEPRTAAEQAYDRRVLAEVRAILEEPW